MAVLFMDGFDHYGTGRTGTQNMLDGVWAQVDDTFGFISVGAPTWGNARTGTNCLLTQSAAATGATARYVLPHAVSTKLFCSFGFAMDFIPFASPQVVIHRVRDANNVAMFTLIANTTGGVALYNGDCTQLLAQTSGPVLRAQTWHFLEMCWDVVDGTFSLRVDDTTASMPPVLTHAITFPNNIAQCDIGGTFTTGAGTMPQTGYDDLFVHDDQGATNNTWLGDRRISTVFAEADSNVQWTPNYYKEFGPGVLQLAYITPTNNTPVNQNSFVQSQGAASLSLGSNDFTLEGYYRFEQLPTGQNYYTLMGRWDAGKSDRQYRLTYGGASFNGGCIQFDYTTDGSAATVVTPIKYPFTPDLNRWYHIAIVRASNELLLFVNGEQLGLPITCTDTFASSNVSNLCIGQELSYYNPVANTYFVGLMDETRITNGYARYNAPFAVPQTQFPRGSADPNWADVVLLCGYDTGIHDESSFNQVISTDGQYSSTLQMVTGAQVFYVNDGPAIGAYSTVSKTVPDDNTFLAASLTPATGVLTMTSQPAPGNTVTVGTKDGTVAAVYTFRTTVAAAFDVLIDTNAQNTLLNLFNAINASGSATKYGAGTTANNDVYATQLPNGQLQMTANVAGTVGNAIATSTTGTAASWGNTTLTGGANIPGPTDLLMGRPPNNTTIISAVQSVIRAFKSDAGVCNIQSDLIGPKGGVAVGPSLPLAVNAGYYNSIFETDPDTNGPITPATLVNGKLRINRPS